MNPVLKQENMAHYVSEYDIIKFIEQNSDMEWNQICDYVRKHNIVAVDDRVAFWEKEYLQNCNEHQLKWIGAFFEAHPFIEKMYVVFD